jgi:voltage-gated potassium channel
MQSSRKHILTGAVFFLLTGVIAVTGYVMAGWNLIDAVYMVVITVFGVGFGEMGPMTPQLRLFTIFVIVAGCTSLGYILGGFIQMITEGEINKALGARRMTREIKTLNQHVIICGYGRIGQVLGKKLVEAKQPFVVIDNNLERIETAEAMGYLVLLGNATDEDILEAAGIVHAKFLATVLPDDSANVFITLTARSLNPGLTILARGEFPSTEKKLRQAGADHVVLPAEIGALRLSHLITHPASLDILDQNDGSNTLTEMLAQIDMQLDELVITTGSPLIGTSIGTIEVRGNRNFLIVALRRADGTTIIRPGQEVFVKEGDTVIVMGHRGDIPRFAEMYALKRQMQYRGARQRRL